MVKNEKELMKILQNVNFKKKRKINFYQENLNKKKENSDKKNGYHLKQNFRLKKRKKRNSSISNIHKFSISTKKEIKNDKSLNSLHFRRSSIGFFHRGGG